MAQFITRVELHKAKDPEDYDILHESMKNQGFTRTIFSDNKIEYYLPTAEYSLISDLDASQVRTKALNAANLTGKKSSIIVVKSSQTAWIGLEIVKKK